MTALTLDDLQTEIEAGWAARETLSPQTTGPIRTAVEETLLRLDAGEARVAEKIDGDWVTHQWLKKAILLSFRLNAKPSCAPGPWAARSARGGTRFPASSTAGPSRSSRPPASAPCRARSCAAAPSSAKNVVLMPSFVNIGAYVGEGTMVDTWATVGSCAQIGKNVHLSGGAGIGGVLEPLQASPTIIEDDCFIGARSEVAEGVIVGEGAVLSMGVFLTASTPIVDRKTGEIFRGYVPPYSVVVPGLPARPPRPRPQPHLRGDRQDRGRPDPLQD